MISSRFWERKITFFLFLSFVDKDKNEAKPRSFTEYSRSIHGVTRNKTVQLRVNPV